MVVRWSEIDGNRDSDWSRLLCNGGGKGFLLGGFSAFAARVACSWEGAWLSQGFAFLHLEGGS